MSNGSLDNCRVPEAPEVGEEVARSRRIETSALVRALEERKAAAL